VTPGPVRRWRGRRADEALLLRTVLFDEDWVGLQLGRVLSRPEAVRAYLEDGGQGGLSPHPLFDFGSIRLRWHPHRLRDLGDGDPLLHYLRERAFGRSTHALFDIEHYLAQAPEAADHPEGPVGHYCRLGAAAGLTAAEWLSPGEDLRDAVVSAARSILAGAEEPAPAPGSLDADLVSVVVVADRPDDAIASVRRLAGVAEPGVEVVLLDNGTALATAASLRCLTAYDGVRVTRVAEPVTPDAARDLLLAQAGGALSLLLAPGVRVSKGWRAPLLDALTDDVAGVQPLLLQSDDLVRSAGWVTGGGHRYPFLAGFPTADAVGLAEHPFAHADVDALLVRTEEARAAAAAPAGFEVALRQGRSFRVVPAVEFAQRGPGPAKEARPALRTDDRDDDVAAWAAAGFEVTSRATVPPEVRWVGPPGSTRPPRRWSIKNAAPAGPIGEVWGDTHFARSLADELRALGEHVGIDAHPAWRRASEVHDDVALVIRGPEAYRAPGGQRTIAWVISHPDTIDPDELGRYDHVTAASLTWAQRASSVTGVEVEVMLQATDARRFHPDTAEPDTGAELLFVGNTRDEYRRTVREALEAGLPLTIIGRGWQYFLDDLSCVAAPSIANAELSAAYRSAGIVLSDHFRDMGRDGFLANRLFDAAASGARVITDEVTGIEGLFGDSVQVYRTREDLVRLATDPDRDALFGDDAARRAVAADVREKHSFAARARRLVEIAAKLDS
jgi:hypothetical protein